MSGMETGTALSRAMTYVMQRNSDPNQQRIDAINMSYGEYSHFSSSGRVGELMAQVINKVGSLSHTIKGLGELAKLVKSCFVEKTILCHCEGSSLDGKTRKKFSKQYILPSELLLRIFKFINTELISLVLFLLYLIFFQCFFCFTY